MEELDMWTRDTKVCLAALVLVLTIASISAAHVIYVDDDAPPAGNGSTWTDAYNHLRDALADANASPKPVEIRVGRGIYKPDEDTLHPNGTGDRKATFQLVNGVTLKGGYAGVGSAEPNALDVEEYETILSGDLAANDVDVNEPNNLFDEPTRAENSYHVVTGSNTDANAVLDGFTIAGGNADGPGSDDDGGGMYEESGNPTVRNCLFMANSAAGGYSYGGGMYSSGKPTLINCTFMCNAASGIYFSSGGGLYCSGSPTLINCIFSANSAWDRGGGMGGDGKATLTNCTFSGNTARAGGGIKISRQAKLTNCRFSNNLAWLAGGGMSGSPQVLLNCRFTANAAYKGGGMFTGSDTNPTNCIFSGNSADTGGGAFAQDCDVVFANCTFSGNSAIYVGGVHNDEGETTLTNCILWRNTDNDGEDESAQIDTADPPHINYSCIQGWTGALGGIGNMAADPCFVSLGYWTDPSGPNAMWVDGDYHLKSQAGRWEPNSQSWLRDDTTSPCIDVGDKSSPIGYEPFPNGGIVNMGAYGGTIEASKSYLGEPVCEIIMAGDINGDCMIDFKDFAIMALHWMVDSN
jgi:hypothetical protein